VLAVGTLLRREVLANVPWDPDRVNDPKARVQFLSQGLTEDSEYLRVEGQFEKNLQAKAKTIRLVPNKNVLQLPLATWAKMLLKGKPAGPLLAGLAGLAFNTRDWQECRDDFCMVTGARPEDVGETSAHKLMALYLQLVGRLSAEEMCAIGFW
jgi:hypothetical protein